MDWAFVSLHIFRGSRCLSLVTALGLDIFRHSHSAFIKIPHELGLELEYLGICTTIYLHSYYHYVMDSLYICSFISMLGYEG